MLNLDQTALRACAAGDLALCTLVGIDGSFSRRIGAQLAIDVAGNTYGSLSDGCLERQLVTEAQALRTTGERGLFRFGKGSPLIDFRLPCGSGIDVLVDPAPDRSALQAAVQALDARQTASLTLPGEGTMLRHRNYIPALRIAVLGEGPEFSAFLSMAATMGIACDGLTKRDASQPGLTLGRAPEGMAVDPWTAILLLFHDHEWETTLLDWALSTPAFYIGAQGGATVRASRLEHLAAQGHNANALERVRSPVGLIRNTRDPGVLALSVLAEIVGAYEALHPHR